MGSISGLSNRNKPLNSLTATGCGSSPMDGGELRDLCRLRAPPDRQTWNPKIEVLKMNFLFQGVIFRFEMSVFKGV